MAGRTGGAGGGGYNYVQDAEPAAPEEGQEWYDTGANAAFVYDGSSWVEQTVVDHGQLSGVQAGQHQDPIPSGVITMWSGTTGDVPAGWTLCDGTDGAPDLQDRFVAGAGGQYAAGDTGGADSVALSESELPSHDHSVTDPGHTHSETRRNGNEGYDDVQTGSQGGVETVQTGESTTGVTVDAAGGDQAHENRPPYFALAFIMKT